MKVFNQLESDMKLLLEWNREIAKLQTDWLYQANVKDKVNYNPERAELMKAKTLELQEKYHSLYSKWF